MAKSEIEIITSPWLRQFRSLIANTRREFVFTSPFIKLPVARLVTSTRRTKNRIRGLINFRLRHFEKGISDLDAVKLLHYNNARLKTVPNLHSKIYIFDSSTAVISSANLTPGGLFRNIELGILVQERGIVLKLKRYFDSLFYDDKVSSQIKNRIIVEAGNILTSIPRIIKRREVDFAGLERDLFGGVPIEEDIVFQGGESAILRGLRGWNNAIFRCLIQIDGITFSLGEVYKFKPILSKRFPRNTEVKAKIRQQLQQLRDMGLLEFLGKGVYRKLWV